MLKNCVNVKSLEFQDLLEQSKLDVITLGNKISRWQDINGVDNYPTLEQLNILPDEVKPNEVQYQLKVIDALKRINRNTFTSDKLQGWINDLKKYGVTDQQVDIFKQYAKDGMSKDEILIDIASNFGFSIEINTSLLDHGGELKPFTHNGNIYTIAARYEGMKYYRNNIEISEDEYTDEYDEFIEKESRPTQHFSNLTSPGVVNYIEKAIVTPEIENIADEHTADFNQNKQTMIGWSRMGEATIGSKLENGYKEVQFDDGQAFLERNLNTVGGTPTNTRVILEIQSGIFQDFRNNEELVPNKAKPLDKEFITEIKQNSFLQLLNKDNNWVRFFIKTTIQDAVKAVS